MSRHTPLITNSFVAWSMLARVHNARGERVSNSLYIPSVIIVCLAAWLSHVCKTGSHVTLRTLIIQITKNQAIFSWFLWLILLEYLFCITFFWHFHSISRSHPLVLETMTTIKYLNCALSLVNIWIPGTWLSKNILHKAFRT